MANGLNGNGNGRLDRLAGSAFLVLLYRGVTTGLGFIILALLGWISVTFVAVRDDVLAIKTSYAIELPQVKEHQKDIDKEIRDLWNAIYSRDRGNK